MAFGAVVKGGADSTRPSLLSPALVANYTIIGSESSYEDIEDFNLFIMGFKMATVCYPFLLRLLQLL